MPASEPASIPRPSQTNPAHRILVVDGDRSIRQINTQMLLLSGYEVGAAENGAAAWQALNTDTYDLLITCHNMPEASGIELLKRLRVARMALPVIMATGTFPKEEFTRYPWLKPTATLLKPYTAEEMLRTVKEVLGTTQGARSRKPSDFAALTATDSQTGHLTRAGINE